jgi:serine/threonine-protein kinase
MAVVLFETLTGQRMFGGDREAAQLLRITQGKTRVPSEVAPELASFDEIVRKASAMNPADRYETAREMARALEAVTPAASPSDVSEWVEAHAGESILERARRVKEIESAAALDVNDVRQSLNEELVRSQSELPSVPSLVSHESPTSPKAKPPWLWIAAAAFALLVGIVVSLLLRSHTRAPDAVAKPSPVQTTSVPASATSGVATSAPLPPTTTQTPTDSPGTPIVAHPPQRGAPGATHASKPDCEQPYVVDSSGHMHFRKECL